MRTAMYDPGPRQEPQGYSNAPYGLRAGSHNGSEAANRHRAVCGRRIPVHIAYKLKLKT